MNRLLLTAALCLGLAAPALAGVPVQKDQLTVSGRFELTKASAEPLKAGLTVSGVQLDPTAAKALVGKPEVVNTAVRGSLEASLRNFGYLGDAAAVPVTATMGPLEVVKEKESTSVIARLTFSAAGDSQAARCVPAIAEGRFKALKPQSAGNGNRAAGVLALVAFAAVGYDASQLVMGQFETAKAQQRAVNARRVVGQGEGVSMSSREAEMLQFAAIHATQLAMADFIRQLGESACNPQPAAVAAEAPAAAPEVVAEPVAAETPAEPATPVEPAQSAAPAT